MWSKDIMNVARLKCILIISGLCLPQALGQNAEPEESDKRNKLGRVTVEHRYNRTSHTINPISPTSTTTRTTKQPFNWGDFAEGQEVLDERKEFLAKNLATELDVVPRATSHKAKKEASSTLASTSNDKNSSQVTSTTAALPTVSRRKSRGKGAERRRRLKQLLAVMSRGKDDINATSSGLEGTSRGLGVGRGVDAELNNVQRPKKDRLNTKRKGRVQTWRKKSSVINTGRDKELKESRERRKKLRLERRRRRNRERKRKNKIAHDGQQGKSRKFRKQKRPQNRPSALHLDHKSNDTGSQDFVDGKFDLAFKGVTEVKLSQKYIVATQQRDEPPAPESEGEGGSPDLKIKEQNSSSLKTHRDHKDNVEKEFSKQFERELSKSKHVKEDGSSKFKGSGSNENVENQRFAGEKILGYSQSDNELPSDDANDEILPRNLKFYQDYVTTGIWLSKLSTSQSLPELRRNSNNSAAPMALDHPTSPRQDQRPYYNLPKKDSSSNKDSGTKLEDVSDRNKHGNSGQIGSEIPTLSANEAILKGDLSCMNGTFLPAPLARHALIKYVKSSTPGHEYLEADYECTPGYSMSTPARRLLCKNRRWVGAMPKCKLRQNPNDVCADSPCEQICGEVNGIPMCACYQGFRQEGIRCIDINECEKNNGGCEFGCRNTPGSYRCECPKGMRQGESKYRCMDINECLLNNGHGPCQDTCVNLERGYRCSCEGLPGTILGLNNHTCQDAGPCGTENAGCSHTCLSTMGRVFCLCPDGFMLEDDWKTCQDVDECAVPDLQSVVCQHGCINTPGSYRCTEPPEMRDEPPSDLVSKKCDPGFEPSVDGGCVDINECSISNGGCLEVCENTAGSYFCACNGDERLLSADGRTCVDINDVACPALNPSGRGYVMCSRLTTPKPWRGRKRVINRPGTKCFLRCPYGYQLRGEYELTCGTNGIWFGSKHGECVRYSKPRLDCPPDLVAEVPPGQTEAFVTFAQPSTDLDWFRYVRSEPSWGTRLEANLAPGEHKITFIAKHPVSKKQAMCTLRITVQPGEAPRIKNCPDNILASGTNDTVVTWTEPMFTDNVKISNIISNKNPGHLFPVGEHKIRYEASDEAGWTAACEFLVTVKSD